jgi:hypothetical protein
MVLKRKTGDIMARTVISAKPSAFVTDVMSNEENEHFIRLQNTRNYLASNGAWLWDDMHYPMLAGQ